MIQTADRLAEYQTNYVSDKGVNKFRTLNKVAQAELNMPLLAAK